MTFELLHTNKEKYHEEYMALQKYCFRGISDEQLKREWEELTPEEGTVIGNIADDQLAAVLTLFHHPVSFYGNEVGMGGVGLVATSPYYREGGYCRKLLEHALAYMDEKEMLFSVLGPFKYSFYEQFGYKWAYRFYTYKVEMDQLKTFANTGQVMPATGCKEVVQTLYSQMAMGCNGMTLRTPKMWEDKWQEKRTTKVVYTNAEGEVEGYMFFNIDNWTFWIEEFHYTTMQAFKGMLNFVYKHRAQAGSLHVKSVKPEPIMDLLQNPYGEVKEESFMMARIVNVQKVLELYPFTQEGTFTIKVEDKHYPKNQGVYHITVTEGKGTVTKEVAEKADVELDIAYLTQLVLGFRKVEELVAIECIQMNEDVMGYFKNTLSTGLYNYF
ncbi:MAG: GNAT family N-acetyltransferase [Cellulosilyticaceae bacterium]